MKLSPEKLGVLRGLEQEVCRGETRLNVVEGRAKTSRGRELEESIELYQLTREL